jgi:hypothetical protein
MKKINNLSMWPISLSLLLFLSLLFSPALAVTTSSEQQNVQQNSQDITDAIDAIDYFDTNMTTEEILAATGMTLESFYSIPGHVSFNVESRDLDKSQNSLLSTPQTVQVYVVVDEDAKLWYEYIQGHLVTWDDVYMWAYNILEGGDDFFWPQYEIDYNMHAYTNWDSPDSTSLSVIFEEGKNTITKPSDCDVRFFITGHNTDMLGPRGISEMLGDDFIIKVRDPTVPMANLFQHEASHNYGAPDHDPGLLDWCVQSYAWIQSTRDWCSSCHTTMYSNRFHFG